MLEVRRGKKQPETKPSVRVRDLFAEENVSTVDIPRSAGEFEGGYSFVRAVGVLRQDGLPPGRKKGRKDSALR